MEGIDVGGADVADAGLGRVVWEEDRVDLDLPFVHIPSPYFVEQEVSCAFGCDCYS